MRCYYCNLEGQAGRIYNGICLGCLGPREKWSACSSALAEEIAKLKRELESARLHRDGLKVCLFDYEKHFRAYQQAIALNRMGEGSFRALREAFGLNQAEAASILGVSAAALSQVERGNRPCPKSWFSDLAEKASQKASGA